MIKLIVLDVDGCLTNGKITYGNTLIETKSFDVKDGLAVSSWVKLGNDVAIITGRKSKIVEYRAKELGIVHLYQGVGHKQEVLQNLVDSLGYSFEEVAAIGDDFNDYQMLQSVGKSFTPNDGVEAIKEIVTHILSKKGGEGAVREMIDMLLQENNQIDAFKALWIK